MRGIVLLGLSVVLTTGILAPDSRTQGAAARRSSWAEPREGVAVTARASSAPMPAADRQAPGSFVEPTWSLIATRGGPAGREDHTWTVDRDGRFAYLFGGRDGAEVFDDLWRYDLARDTWRRLSPPGRRPVARFGHSAVWAEGHGLVIFAGQLGTDFFGDLWAYDPDDDRWTRLPGRGAAPRPRYGSCMVVGLDGRLWISHGFTFLGRFDDTRVYDLERRRWASIVHDGRRPGKRCLHECFAATNGELALYGGQDDDDPALGDLWVRRERGSWLQLPRPSAPARRLYAITIAGDSAWIFGGTGRDGRRLDDLWRVDRDSLAFKRVQVAGVVPSARSASALITDAAHGRLLLFGGQGAGARSDVWQLTEASSSAEE